MRASRAMKARPRAIVGKIRLRRNGQSPSLERMEPLHRQPVELQREQIRQHVAHHEDRHGKAEHRQRHHRTVDPGAVLPRRQHTQRDCDDDGKHYRQNHQRQRRFDALRDHVADRQVGEDRGAKIAVHDLPEPLAEPHEERPIKTKRGTDAFDVGGRGLIARDDRRGIAGRQIQQAEHEERNDKHYRNGGQDAPRGVGEHAVAAGSACGPTGRTRRIVADG